MPCNQTSWARLGIGAHSTNHWGMNNVHHSLLPPRTGKTCRDSGISLLLSMSKLIETDRAPVHGVGVWGASGRAFHLRPSLWAVLRPPSLSLLALQTLAQECPSSLWPSLANFEARVSKLLVPPQTSCSSLLTPPVFPPSSPAGPQSTLALAQSIESSLPVHALSL